MAELRFLEDVTVKLDTAESAALGWMEVGLLGVHGTHVVKAVVPVNKNADEAVQNRRLATVVKFALDHPETIERATRATVQYTVVGQVGVDGLHALSPVEPVPKNVLEPVLVPLHVMAGTFALETRGKNYCATSSYALYTVVGQVGVDGQHALSPVEPVLKNVLEPVPVPLHVMAGDHA